MAWRLECGLLVFVVIGNGGNGIFESEFSKVPVGDVCCGYFSHGYNGVAESNGGEEIRELPDYYK